MIIRLRLLATIHAQINTFVEEENETEIVYPALICEKKSGTIDRVNHQTFLNFSLTFIDKMNVSEQTNSNRLEVQSDMLSVAEDYKALMEDGAYDDWFIGETAPYQFVDERYNDDVVSGVSIDVSIGLMFLSDRCRVPATTDPIENVLITSEGNFLALGNDYYLKVS